MLIVESRASLIIFNVLRSLGQDTEFILPLNVCPIVPAVFRKAGVPFRFVDIDPRSLSIEKSVVIDMVKKSKKNLGLLFVRPYGNYSDESVFFTELKRLDESLFIIDDRCLCVPETQLASDSNECSDLVLFSTGYSKFVDFGWGGYGWLREHHSYLSNRLSFVSQDLADLTAAFEHSLKTGAPLNYVDSDWLGADSTAYDSIATYLGSIAASVEKIKRRKLMINQIYAFELSGYECLGDGYNDWRFNILVDNKKQLLQAIFDAGLFASSHYASLERMYGQQYKKRTNADIFHSKVINLFNDHRVSLEQVEKSCTLLKTLA